MKNLNDIYKMLIKEYSDWNIEYDKKNDYILMKKDGFSIGAYEGMVSIIKKYNKFLYLDTHCHPETPKDVYERIVYYINNKDMLLKKQIKKDKILIICLLIIIVLVLILWFISR